MQTLRDPKLLFLISLPSKQLPRQRAAELGIDASDMLKVIDQQIRVGSYGADELNRVT